MGIEAGEGKVGGLGCRTEFCVITFLSFAPTTEAICGLCDAIGYKV